MQQHLGEAALSATCRGCWAATCAGAEGEHSLPHDGPQRADHGPGRARWLVARGGGPRSRRRAGLGRWRAHGDLAQGSALDRQDGRRAAVFIVRPAGVAAHSAESSAKPRGSRARAMMATRFCGARGVRTQSRLGRITSAPISSSAQTRRLLEVDTPARGLRGRAQASSGRHHWALPAASAPLTSHRCCHVSPGCSTSQSSSRANPSRRRARAAGASSMVNGVVSNRASSTPRVCSVIGHDGTGERGEKRRHSWVMSGPIGRAEPAVGVCSSGAGSAGALTTSGHRTAHPATHADTHSAAPQHRYRARLRPPCRAVHRGGDERGPRRSRRRASVLTAQSAIRTVRMPVAGSCRCGG